MPFIQEEDRKALRDHFAAQLQNPVKLVMFTQRKSKLVLPFSHECQFCEETRGLVEELAGLSDHLTAEIYDFVRDQEAVATYGIDKIPAIALVGEKDSRIRYFGIPAGYEFTALVEDLVDVSRGTTSLSPTTKENLARVDTDVHIQVYETPTCPYCPLAVRVSHQMALENDHIRADTVEAIEFPHLAHRYRVMGVPKVVINETIQFEGALPEHLFLLYVLQAADRLDEEDQALLKELEEQQAAARRRIEPVKLA